MQVVIPVVKNAHYLLVTLLLCNAVAMETLPLLLDKMVHETVAIIISVTAVLLFGGEEAFGRKAREST
jgi:metal transporter CNNM